MPSQTVQQSGSYLVTISRPGRAQATPVEHPRGDRGGIWRARHRLVDTPEEAREAVVEIIDGYGWGSATGADATYAELEREAMALPEAGGTVGPLPDGTVIEVAALSSDGGER